MTSIRVRERLDRKEKDLIFRLYYVFHLRFASIINRNLYRERCLLDHLWPFCVTMNISILLHFETCSLNYFCRSSINKITLKNIAHTISAHLCIFLIFLRKKQIFCFKNIGKINFKTISNFV